MPGPKKNTNIRSSKKILKLTGQPCGVYLEPSYQKKYNISLLHGFFSFCKLNSICMNNVLPSWARESFLNLMQKFKIYVSNYLVEDFD